MKYHILSTFGVIADYFTTIIGLQKGFVESHPMYSVPSAFVVFSVTNTVLHFLPEQKWKSRIQTLFALTPFLGAFYNLGIMIL